MKGILINIVTFVLFAILGGKDAPEAHTFLRVAILILALVSAFFTYGELEYADSCLHRILLFLNLAFSGLCVIMFIVFSAKSCGF